MPKFIVSLLSVLLIVTVAFAADDSTSNKMAPQPIAAGTADAPRSLDQVIDRIMQRENEFVKTMKEFHPLVETYIQEMRPDDQLGTVPYRDEYFLGRLDLSAGAVNAASYLEKPKKDGKLDKLNFGPAFMGKLTSLFQMRYMPLGFANMVLVDDAAFDRQHYQLEFVRREFLGGVRCLLFDVSPLKGAGTGRFMGRIWVEDEGYSIVRTNGTYVPRPRRGAYMHFDSWRLNVQGMWLPAYVYVEDSEVTQNVAGKKVHLKGQTRLWGYERHRSNKDSEFASILVDSPNAQDRSESEQDGTPLESVRAFERMAEENVVDRMERAGLMAPPSEVDKVLLTVVNNLQITNNLEIPGEVRCRVLLTAPLESFTVGHTIVLSRGLIDVLPDEASLAMVLSHELAHIALGHRLDSKFSFSDRMIFEDQASLQLLGFTNNPAEEDAADKKAIEYLRKSPYKDKLGNAGLFLRALADRAPSLPHLIHPHLGNGLANATMLRMGELMQSAPALEMNKTDQVAALPMGARLKINPWNGAAELSKAKPMVVVSPREKMPFEVTPVLPWLARSGQDARENKKTDEKAVAAAAK